MGLSPVLTMWRRALLRAWWKWARRDLAYTQGLTGPAMAEVILALAELERRERTQRGQR